jgi:hypothetical protein
VSRQASAYVIGTKVISKSINISDRRWRTLARDCAVVEAACSLELSCLFDGIDFFTKNELETLLLGTVPND